MANPARENKRALVLLTVPDWENQPFFGESLESWKLSHQREAIKRKAAELDAEIVTEFQIPKHSCQANSPKFREMLHMIAEQQIDYVLIYPGAPHRNYVESKRMVGAINAAGARVFSARNFEEIPEVWHGILNKIANLDQSIQMDAQRKAAWRRARRAKDAA